MKKFLLLAIVGMFAVIAIAQDRGGWISSLPQVRDYIQKRSSSYDRSGGNNDARPIASGETLVLLDEPGPGLVSHIWVTIASSDPLGWTPLVTLWHIARAHFTPPRGNSYFNMVGR